MIIDVFQQFYELIVSQLITIPINNVLGSVYSVLNLVALFFVQLITGEAITIPSIL
ncbi:MAG: hypothetical protein HYV27_13225 [Candidatus Hydrogenedentes bacterium]|nr:hypothetical protein [Candidatus Hydrogenedentota bacterium]